MGEISLKDIINVLCYYDINKVESPQNIIASAGEGNFMYGLSDDHAKRILIEKNQCMETMRETILHELYHCHHYLLGDLSGKSFKYIEDVVTRQARNHFLDIYQVK